MNSSVDCDVQSASTSISGSETDDSAGETAEGIPCRRAVSLCRGKMPRLAPLGADFVVQQCGAGAYVYVSHVLSGGPADKGGEGLETGDAIVAVGGFRVHHLAGCFCFIVPKSILHAHTPERHQALCRSKHGSRLSSNLNLTADAQPPLLED